MSRPLCTYSRSEVLERDVLASCPLQLSQAEHEQCPCRQRVQQEGLRVLACLYPRTWSGTEIRDPIRFAESLRRRWHNEAKSTPPHPKEKEQAVTSQPLWPHPIPVIGGTGEYASGKTLFGLTICPGPQTLVYDTEKSSESYLALGFDRVDVPAEMVRRFPRGYKPIDLFGWWRDHIRAVPAGKYRVIMLDTVSEVETGLADYVLANPKEFGRTPQQYARATGLLWGDVKEHWKAILSDLASRCETFYFVSHLKAVWAGNAPTGKKAPKGKSTLEELASLYLWFERRPNASGETPAVPAAVVRKSRLAHTHIDANGIQITPALPPRIPAATPATIREYQRNPPRYDRLRPEELAPEEKVTEAEMAELRARTAEAEVEAERLRTERLRHQEEAEERARQRATARPQPPADESAKPAAPAPAEGQQGAEDGQPQSTTAETTFAVQAGPTEAQLARLKALRDELFDLTGPEDRAATWKAILAKRQATSAMELTEFQARELIGKLEAQVAIERDRREGAPTGTKGGR